MSPAEKFAAKYDVMPDGCWNWRFPKPGMADRANTFMYQGKVMTAYRASYLMNKGPIPEGMLVCHSCDNGLCVNPEHLWLGSYADNMADMHQKGRANTPYGLAKSKIAKLDPEKVKAIRAEYIPRKVSIRKLASRYGVSYSTIHEIILGQNWKQVK